MEHIFDVCKLLCGSIKMIYEAYYLDNTHQQIKRHLSIFGWDLIPTRFGPDISIQNSLKSTAKLTHLLTLIFLKINPEIKCHANYKKSHLPLLGMIRFLTNHANQYITSFCHLLLLFTFIISLSSHKICGIWVFCLFIYKFYPKNRFHRKKCKVIPLILSLVRSN